MLSQMRKFRIKTKKIRSANLRRVIKWASERGHHTRCWYPVQIGIERPRICVICSVLWMGLCVEWVLQLVVSMRPTMFVAVIHLSEWAMCFRWPFVAAPNLYIVPLVRLGIAAQLLEHFRVIQVFGLKVEKNQTNSVKKANYNKKTIIIFGPKYFFGLI